MRGRPHRHVSSGLVTVAMVLLCLQLGTAAEPASRQVQFFETQIRPLFEKYCVACHSAERASGKLRVDSRAAVLIGGSRGAAFVRVRA